MRNDSWGNKLYMHDLCYLIDQASSSAVEYLCVDLAPHIAPKRSLFK